MISNRLIEVYPAKTRFYSTGRWEAWNKLPNGSKQPQYYRKIKRIQGKYYGDSPTTTENSIFTWNFQNYSHTPQQSSINSPCTKKLSTTLYRSAKKSKIKPKKILNFPNIDTQKTSQKYSYSVCMGNIDIKGKQITQHPIKFAPTPDSSSSRLQNTMKKLEKSKFFQLPSVTVPSPWQVLTKSIEET